MTQVIVLSFVFIDYSHCRDTCVSTVFVLYFYHLHFPQPTVTGRGGDKKNNKERVFLHPSRAMDAGILVQKKMKSDADLSLGRNGVCFS